MCLQALTDWMYKGHITITLTTVKAETVCILLGVFFFASFELQQTKTVSVKKRETDL